MKINIQYENSVSSAPAAFTATVNQVVSLLDSLFQNNATMNIVVGWGTVNGTPLSAGNLGSSISSLTGTTYSVAETAILNTNSAWHSDNPSSVPLMQTTYPVSNATIAINTADAKALGLPTSTAIDGYVGFNSNANWAYNENGTIGTNQYDLFSTILHEVTEVMGRIADVGVDGFYTAMDLFRYSSLGNLDHTTGGAGSTAYFSTDGGVTHLGTWNDDPTNGDLGDWYPNGPGLNGYDAANDYGSPGHFEPLSQVDITLMDALGWNALKTQVVVTDQSKSGITVAVPITLYQGPVAGLNFQYSYTGSDNTNVTATVGNQFVHTGAGTDAIDFRNVIGNNVLDGGTGSNFLVGTTNAASHDTFFLDDRSPPADIWSTVVNFHAGDAVTIFGITPTSATVSWVDNQGASGYQGLTAHVVTPGHPEASITLAGLTTADLANGHLSLTYGTEPDGTPYLYIYDLV